MASHCSKNTSLEWNFHMTTVFTQSLPTARKSTYADGCGSDYVEPGQDYSTREFHRSELIVLENTDSLDSRMPGVPV